MPSRRTEGTPPTEESTGTGMQSAALSDSVRADLLRAQQASIQTPQDLPKVRVMPAGAGLYEFKDTTDTVRTFRGVIIHSHPRNVLWDKVFGEPTMGGGDEPQLPACGSPDGIFGIPREGFEHADLSEPARGTERIPCASCTYNQWGTGSMFNPRSSPKGKAVTNQRSVYVLMEDRSAPVELILSPASLTSFDGYLTKLLNQGIPVQAVVTEFAQEVKSRPGTAIRWGVATFTNAGLLSDDAFRNVLAKMETFHNATHPSSAPVAPPVQGSTAVGTAVDAEMLNEDDDDLPF